MTPILIEPRPGQESVWDYPRPPRVEVSPQSIIVRYNEYLIAQSDKCLRVLERSHPPCYYIPIRDIHLEFLEKSPGVSHCEWKGTCSYYRFRHLDYRVERAGWRYEHPKPGYECLADTMAFYPSRLRCFLDGTGVRPQDGHYYGGWITRQVVGPFKGGQGTWSW